MKLCENVLHDHQYAIPQFMLTSNSSLGLLAVTMNFRWRNSAHQFRPSAMVTQ